MTDHREIIKLLAQLEQYNYVLTQLIKWRWHLVDELRNINVKPEPPEKPKNTNLLELPVYNEKKYYEMTKNKSTDFTHAAIGLFITSIMMVCSIYGIILAPFPLIASIVLFICIPTRKRKMARKAYFQECEEIDQHNQQAMAQVEEYQRKYAEYEQKLRHYEQLKKDYQYQEKMLEYYINLAQKAQKDIENSLSSFYKSSPTLKHRGNYIFIITANAYLQENAYATLNNAVQYFDDLKNSGKIAPSIEYALDNKTITQDNMASVMQALDEAQNELKKIRINLMQHLSTLSEDSANISSTKGAPSLTFLCSEAKEHLANLATCRPNYL